MVELIVGRWYELYTYNDRFIFKLSDHQNLNTIPVIKACTPHDNYVVRCKGYMGPQYRDKITFANMEEVYKFFPEEITIEPTYELW